MGILRELLVAKMDGPGERRPDLPVLHTIMYVLYCHYESKTLDDATLGLANGACGYFGWSDFR